MLHKSHGVFLDAVSLNYTWRDYNYTGAWLLDTVVVVPIDLIYRLTDSCIPGLS